MRIEDLRLPSILGPLPMHLLIIPVAGSGSEGFNPVSHSHLLKVPPSPGLLSTQTVPIKAEQCLETKQYPPTVDVKTIGSLHQVN